MLKKASRLWLVWISFLVSAVPAAAALPMNEQAALWKNDSFAKTAENIRRGDWNKTQTREIVIVGLYELGRTADRLESRLQLQLDRFYGFAYVGALVLGVYLVLQLVLSLVMVIRLARAGGRASVGGAAPPEENYRL